MEGVEDKEHNLGAWREQTVADTELIYEG